MTAAGFRHPRLRAGAPFDLVFANILAGPLRRLAPRARARTSAGRRRDPVGDPGAAGGGRARRSTAPGATGAGRPVRIGDWTTLVLRRAALSRLSARGERSSASLGDLAAVQADVGELLVGQPRSALSVARALRQAAKRVERALDERDDAEGGDGPERDRSGWSRRRTFRSSLSPGRRIRPLGTPRYMRVPRTADNRDSCMPAMRFAARTLNRLRARATSAPWRMFWLRAMSGARGDRAERTANARHRDRPRAAPHRLGRRRRRRARASGTWRTASASRTGADLAARLLQPARRS